VYFPKEGLAALTLHSNGLCCARRVLRGKDTVATDTDKEGESFLSQIITRKDSWIHHSEPEFQR
jgi:phosphoribosylaminoimidazole (AIR) synthetase